MKLKDCTKEELLYIIKRLTWLDNSCLQRILNEVEYEQVKKKLAEAEKWSKIADDCLKKYIDILKKYEGKKATDIPLSDWLEMERLLKDREKADKKYDKLIKEVDAYET